MSAGAAVAVIAVAGLASGCAGASRPLAVRAVPLAPPPLPPPPRVAPPVAASAARYRAKVPGRLPANGDPVVDGIRLPAGHRGAGGVPMWETAGATPEAVLLASRLAVAFPRTGLWPILWEGSDEPSSYMERGGDVAAIGRESVSRLLPRMWHQAVAASGAGPPFSASFPGIAPPSPRARPSNPFMLFYGERSHMILDDLGPYRLLLIPCRRPADAITTVDFQLITSVRLADISTVLRSWEDRFGARVVLFGSSAVILAVASPPRTVADADRLGNELLAISPPPNAAKLSDLASALMGHANPLSMNYQSSDFTPRTWAIGWDD